MAATKESRYKIRFSIFQVGTEQLGGNWCREGEWKKSHNFAHIKKGYLIQ